MGQACVCAHLCFVMNEAVVLKRWCHRGGTERGHLEMPTNECVCQRTRKEAQAVGKRRRKAEELVDISERSHRCLQLKGSTLLSEHARSLSFPFSASVPRVTAHLLVGVSVGVLLCLLSEPSGLCALLSCSCVLCACV